MRVLIAAGGTGGHIYPAAALIQCLREKTTTLTIHWVSGRRELELALISSLGVSQSALPAKKLPRGNPWKWPLFIWSLAVSMLESIFILASFRPHVVVGFGSFHSYPVVIAARLMRIPCIICEQNAVPSLTNKALAGWASTVVLSFAESRHYLSKRAQDKSLVLGNPIRRQILEMSRESAVEKLGLCDNKFTLLFVGGSLGAHTINKAAVEALEMLQHSVSPHQLQYLLISGEEDYTWARAQLSTTVFAGHVFPYMNDISPALAMSDLVVARSGAGTVAEITARGLAAILIPYPFATNEHQLENARLLAACGAAILVEEGSLSPTTLATAIERLIDDERARAIIIDQSRALGKPNAADELAQLILKLLEGK
jgi:UDP-N-acetylglucosamine--N-acetylmuramyl-(pentapeptide) pyrophosphoryl-undecaprenol N-acetylglucosamine transferase